MLKREPAGEGAFPLALDFNLSNSSLLDVTKIDIKLKNNEFMNKS